MDGARPSWLRTPSARRDLLIIVGVATAFYVIAAQHPPFTSSLRYYEASREMATSGDWIVPHLNFVPYIEKPILVYWLGALSYSLFGGANWALHLPAFLPTVGTLIATWLLGRQITTPGRALAASLMLFGSAMTLGLSTFVLTDQLLTCALAFAWLAFWKHDRTVESGELGSWRWLFWLCIGVGFLAKGPIAIVLAGMAIGGYLFLKGGLRCVWNEGWALAPLRGLAVIALINLPWNWALWQRDPRFIEMFYIRTNFKAFSDGSINHPGPIWYYLVVVPASFMPWTLALLPAMTLALWRPLASTVSHWRGRIAVALWRGNIRNEATSDREQRLATLWLTSIVLFPLLFLSISASKLPYYPLPLYAALSLLIIDLLADRLTDPPRWLRWGLLVQAVFLVVGVGYYLLRIVEPRQLEQIDWQHGIPAAVGVSLVLLSLVIGGIMLARRQVVPGFVISGCGFVLGLALALPGILDVRRGVDARELAALALAESTVEDHWVIAESCAHDHSIVWTINRPLCVVGLPRELGMGLFTDATPQTEPLLNDPYKVQRSAAPEQSRLWTDFELAVRFRADRRVWLFTDEEHRDALRAAGLPIFEVGHTKRAVLLTNHKLVGNL
ncbi:MAG: glycosyltransferase family 39 protein [Planctomycetota bacterium]